jgi:hypothetical protein
MERKRINIAAALRRRAQYLGVVFIYLLAVKTSYQLIVAPTYTAWGFGINAVPVGYRLASYVFAFVPALLMPRLVERPSHLMCHLQYLIIYIPCCLILLDSMRPVHLPADLIQLDLAMLCGMLILIAGAYMPVPELRGALITEKTYWLFHYVLTAGLFAYLLFVFGRFGQFVSFEDVYEIRASAWDLIELEGQAFSNYAQFWLGGFCLPLLAARALQRRKKGLSTVVVAGYVYLFTISGAKAFLLAPMILFVIWRICHAPREIRSSIMTGGCAVLLALPLLIPDSMTSLENIRFWYATTINARMFSVPQLALGQYFDFFSNNPTTHLGHVRIINWLATNPYREDIPYMLGYHYYGQAVGLNVGTWGQDGIAGFGLMGIALVSVIAAVFFWLLDVGARNLELSFTLVAVGYAALCFTNLSLFTTILSGGGLFILLVLLALPREQAGRRTMSVSAARLSSRAG